LIIQGLTKKVFEERQQQHKGIQNSNFNQGGNNIWQEWSPF
jgi:hypothetical protein